MLVKHNRQPNAVLAGARAVWQRRRIRILGITAALTAFIVSAAYAALYVYENRQPIYERVLLPTVAVLKSQPQFLPLRWVTGRFANPTRITIDMNHKAYMKLAYLRQNAIAAGHLVSDDESFVPATVRSGDRKVRADVRLKGDWTDHLLGEKWSFRIKIKGEETLFGMSQFSVQHPATRNYVYEWLFHRALEREGIVALRYDFVDVTLNGKDLGIYALEEFFEKRLIEHNRRREGPIVRFNEDLLWAERFQQTRVFPGAKPNGNGVFTASPVDGFQQNRVFRNAASTALYDKAVYLLEAFRRGDLEASQVFDASKLGRYMALTDIFGSPHATMWQNMRFYYSPITSLLEPIGFDANAGKPLRAVAASIDGVDLGDDRRLDQLRTTFFHDPVVYEEYIRSLERMSKPAYLDALFRDVDRDLRSKLAILYSEFPGFRFNKEVLYRNQRYVATVLQPEKGLHAYFDQCDGGRLGLELGGIHSLPVEVLGASLGPLTLVGPKDPLVLPAKRPDQPAQYRREVFSLPAGTAWADSMVGLLRVQYRLLGSSSRREAEVYRWSYLGDRVRSDDFMRLPPNWREFECFVTDEARRSITIRPGAWTIDRSLILPRGYTVQCAGGAELNLVHGAVILSRSPLELVGAEGNPVSFVSRDGSGQGLVVMADGRLSTLDYVVFDNLSNPSQGGWVLTGAVTFYESPLRATHCSFLRNRCEDAINTFRGHFELEQCLFAQTRADAFDADFCTGTMQNVRFDSLGNDAIDVSGSQVKLASIDIRRAGDKGVSAGENSQVTADDVEVKDSEIALASKDKSELRVSHSVVDGCKVGATAYRKKPEFGGAYIALDDVAMHGVKATYLIENGSRAAVNGRLQDGHLANVEAMFYGHLYGRASR